MTSRTKTNILQENTHQSNSNEYRTGQLIYIYTNHITKQTNDDNETMCVSAVLVRRAVHTDHYYEHTDAHFYPDKSEDENATGVSVRSIPAFTALNFEQLC